jgi:hypothetical protein
MHRINGWEAMHALLGKAVFEVFTPHVLRERDDGMAASQVAEPCRLPLVFVDHGQRIQPATSSGIVIQQARGAELTVAGTRVRQPKRLRAADAGAVIPVRKENGRSNAQDAGFGLRVQEPVNIQHIRLPSGQRLQRRLQAVDTRAARWHGRESGSDRDRLACRLGQKHRVRAAAARGHGPT